MILVFIILGIIIFITLTMLIFRLSNIKLEIKKLHISNVNKKLEAKFILNLGVFLFNKIKIISFNIDNYKISNLLKVGKIDFNKLNINKAANKDILITLKSSEYVIEYFKLEGYFSTFNPVLSSSIYAAINAIIPVLIATRINGEYINNIQFMNASENIINIELDCIISLKIVNIINILHYLKKKGGRENNGKSSNRRPYAYSNE